jgi:hypothetical protein
VVVYGHGQGAGNVVNCAPDRAPDDSDAMVGRRIANDLAAHGYLAVSIYYRNRGPGIPAIGELRGRDHYLLDARAFLAAARMARDELGGQSRAALIGVSMGSFPATWATAPLPELADLQEGLELVTSIPTAMLGNHIGNTGRNQGLLTSTDLATRRGAIVLAAFLSVSTRTALALDRSLTAEDLTGGRVVGLTAAGVELLRRAVLDPPDASLPGCAALGAVPVLCSADCYASTFSAVASSHSITGVTVSDWVTSETSDAINYWAPPDAVDPGATNANALLAGLRELSPAYTLAGPLKARRMLPLTSLGDHVVTDQLAGSNKPADLYLARLRSTGVTIPDPVPVVRSPACGHGDYLDPAKPGCGWTIVLDELATAFAQ